MPRPRFPSRRRLLAIGKWAGLITCIAIAGVWGASGWCFLTALRTRDRSALAVSAWSGQLCLSHVELRNRVPAQYDFDCTYAPRMSWRWEFYRLSRPDRTEVHIPLWAPFLLAAAPTALLWWRSRRPAGGPGHCRCGYSLAGLEGKPCPECGSGS